MSFRIQAVHAFLAVDEEDEEGVIGELTRMGWLPFVAANEERLEQLRPRAKAIAQATGKQIRLVRFSVREDLETIDA